MSESIDHRSQEPATPGASGKKRAEQHAQKKAAAAQKRGQQRREPVAVYDPIISRISSKDVCSDLFVRAYAFPKKQRKPRTGPASRHALPTLGGCVIVIDTETVNHELTFGVAEVFEGRKLRKRFVFYHDELPRTDPAGFERLREICIALDIKLCSRNAFFAYWLWPAREHGHIVAGFNIAYDLSRLADSFEPATKTGRIGSRFSNGFAFKKHFTTKEGVQTPAFCRIRRDDRHHVRYDMRNAAVLDLATWPFAHTDKNFTLGAACEAFGVPFDDRPGEHSGEITRENVAGCLYDVAKTSALLWALHKEHSRHPIDLHPVRAQSPAAIAKAYLAAQGIPPRLDVQPDFPPAYQGFAAGAYFGGRVEARIVKTPLPCTYLDFLSMYATVFDLLGLWFSHVIPKRLQVEEIPPCEVEALLQEVRIAPSILFDSQTWPRLAFFAQVLPNGASLPARVEIPSHHVSQRARIDAEAACLYDEQVAAEAPFWAALDTCGGKIIPDVLYDPRKRSWRAAGEFDDLPGWLRRKNRKRPPTGLAHGNLDEIAQHVRDALGNPELTTGDVLRFFVAHPHWPSMPEARREAQTRILGPNPRSGSLDRGQDEPNDVRNITVSPVESDTPLSYAGPDLAAAALRGGSPTIVRAWRIRPQNEALLDTLTPIEIRGEDRVDPRTENFFTRLIEERKRKSRDDLDNERRSTGYKTVANSGAYGVSAETNPIDIDPETEHDPQPVVVHGDTCFVTKVDRPERPGRYCFFPIASLVTAGARLMLALGFHEVERRGGCVAYCDTDSLVVVATKDGGFVPCDNGPYRLPDGTRAVRALSWTEVEAVRKRFAALNPYDPTKLPGSILKLEDENFDPVTHEQRELWCYAVSEKSYALYTLDETGAPIVQKYSAHVLGQYRSPIEGDRQGWIVQAWEREIRKALGLSTEPFAWETLPAISQLTLTTWSVFKPYRENAALHPFDFLAVASPPKGLNAIAALYDNNGDEVLACCDEPRPAAPLFDDPRDWDAQPWRCLRCGTEIAARHFRTYASVIRGTLESFEVKRLLADGTPLDRESRGFTIPRPVRVRSKTFIGKEVIVDPTDTSEMLTAEMLSATQVLVYVHSEDEARALLDAVRARGIRETAREAGISYDHLREAVNGKSRPRAATLAKLRTVFSGRDNVLEVLNREFRP